VEVEVDQVLEAEQQRAAGGVEARDHLFGAARVEVVLQRVGIDIGSVEDRPLHRTDAAVVRNVAQLDLASVIGDVRGTAGRGVDELEAAAAVEHEVRVALGAVGNEEQAELLVRLKVRGRIEGVQVHGVAGLERTAARPGRGLPRQRIGVLNAREHDLGVADRAVLVNQLDPEHVL
jgi:hypothetical protein